MKDRALSDEAKDQLERWSPKGRAMLDELLEDAGSTLQAEFVARAVAAGHPPSEVHAFAAAIRLLTDAETFRACTLGETGPQDSSVAELLRAQADPLYAFELKGGRLDPSADADDEWWLPAPPTSGGARAGGFDSRTAPIPAGKKSEWNELGGHVPPAPRPESGAQGAGTTAAAIRELGGPADWLLEGYVNEATGSFAVQWREHELDTPEGLRLEDALRSAAQALATGLPIPCTIGPKTGQSRRVVLLLQLSTAGRTRAWQLYDPLSAELVWANEGDLLARTELPFAAKTNRRLTRILLPRTTGAPS